MRAVTSRRRPTPRNRIWFVAPLAVFALVSLTISTLAHRSAGGYPTTPFFHLFFSDTLPLKASLATGVSILAVFQLLTAARTFDVFHFPPSRHFWARMHRLSGYLAILVTLPIAYHCVFRLGLKRPACGSRSIPSWDRPCTEPSLPKWSLCAPEVALAA